MWGKEQCLLIPPSKAGSFLLGCLLCDLYSLPTSGVRQIGRTAWLKGSDGRCRYPQLKKLAEVDIEEIDLGKTFKRSSEVAANGQFHAKPLEGRVTRV